VNEKAGLNTLRFYRKMGQWDKYIAFADPFLEKHGKTQEIYNSVAWEIVANSDDIPALEKALVYSEKSIALDKQYGNTDTRANVLYKLKKYKQAKAAAKESISLAKKEKLDYTSTQELLDKIEKAMR
jgi:tetratricopeptide (TPR) repeat protein